MNLQPKPRPRPLRRHMRKSCGIYGVDDKDTVPTVEFPITEWKPDESYTNLAAETSNILILSQKVDTLSKFLKQEKDKSEELTKRLEQVERDKSFVVEPKCLDMYPEIAEFHRDKPEEEMTHEEKIRILEYKFEHAKLLNANARNKIHFLRKELDKLKRLLYQEVGEGTNYHLLLKYGSAMGWKGRSQKITILNNRISNLQARIEELKHGGRFDHGFEGDFSPPIMARDEDYIPSRARRTLKIMDRNRQRAVEQMGRDCDNFLKEYEELKKAMKAQNCRNRILHEELVDSRKQLKTYQEKCEEDADLIGNLMKHQQDLQKQLAQEKKNAAEAAMRNREVLEELKQNHVEDTNMLGQLKSLMGPDEGAIHSMETFQASVASGSLPPGETDSDVGTLDTEDVTEAKVEYEKYKTLFRSSKEEKERLEEMVAMLNRRLDEVTNQVIEAEKHCREQQCQISDMKRKLESLDDKGKKKLAAVDQEPKSTRYVVLEEQMQVLKQENQFLRTFLQKAVMTKEEDFRLYQSSMEGVKRLYLKSLLEIKRQVSKTDQE